MRDDIRARALHLHFTEGVRSAEARTMLEREFPDADADITKALWYVGFSGWKSGCHGMKWDPNIDSFVRTHRMEKGNVRVRIRPDPARGDLTEYVEPDGVWYVLAYIAESALHQEWLKHIER